MGLKNHGPYRPMGTVEASQSPSGAVLRPAPQRHTRGVGERHAGADGRTEVMPYGVYASAYRTLTTKGGMR